MSREDRRSGSDRRAMDREPVSIPIHYSAVDVFFTEFASNINDGGMFIETDTPAELDTIVKLKFGFPDIEQHVFVEGRVAWVHEGVDEKPTGMGIEFQNLSQEARDTINTIGRTLRSRN